MQVGELEGTLQGPLKVQARCQFLGPLQTACFQGILEELERESVGLGLVSVLLSVQLIHLVQITLWTSGSPFTLHAISALY